jgi:hypothetical protein
VPAVGGRSRAVAGNRNRKQRGGAHDFPPGLTNTSMLSAPANTSLGSAACLSTTHAPFGANLPAHGSIDLADALPQFLPSSI